MRYEYLLLVGSAVLTENQRAPIVPCATAHPVQCRAKCQKLDVHKDGSLLSDRTTGCSAGVRAVLRADKQWSRRVSILAPVLSGPPSTVWRQTRSCCRRLR